MANGYTRSEQVTLNGNEWLMSNKAGAITRSWGDGEGGTGLGDLYLNNIPEKYWRALGYTGPTSYTEGHGESAQDGVMSPELAQWAADNGYQYGVSHRGNDYVNQIFKNGAAVSPEHIIGGDSLTHLATPIMMAFGVHGLQGAGLLPGASSAASAGAGAGG